MTKEQAERLAAEKSGGKVLGHHYVRTTAGSVVVPDIEGSRAEGAGEYNARQRSVERARELQELVRLERDRASRAEALREKALEERDQARARLMPEQPVALAEWLRVRLSELGENRQDFWREMFGFAHGTEIDDDTALTFDSDTEIRPGTSTTLMSRPQVPIHLSRIFVPLGLTLEEGRLVELRGIYVGCNPVGLANFGTTGIEGRIWSFIHLDERVCPGIDVSIEIRNMNHHPVRVTAMGLGKRLAAGA